MNCHHCGHPISVHPVQWGMVVGSLETIRVALDANDDGTPLEVPIGSLVGIHKGSRRMMVAPTSKVNATELRQYRPHWETCRYADKWAPPYRNEYI